ncbi:MAG TPA: transcriptional regulator [Rhodospirillaceae bacterium]|nr:transcriptional regulator [Rhodospirillaceae bacterium]
MGFSLCCYYKLHYANAVFNLFIIRIVVMHLKEKVNSKADVVDISVGKRIKALRLVRGLSQEQVAQELGVSFQQVQKYEKGKNRLSASRIYALSEVLGVEVNDFYSDTEMRSGNTVKHLSVLESIGKEELEIIRLFERLSNRNVKKNFVKLLKSLLQDEK